MPLVDLLVLGSVARVTSQNKLILTDCPRGIDN